MARSVRLLSYNTHIHTYTRIQYMHTLTWVLPTQYELSTHNSFRLRTRKRVFRTLYLLDSSSPTTSPLSRDTSPLGCGINACMLGWTRGLFKFLLHRYLFCSVLSKTARRASGDFPSFRMTFPTIHFIFLNLCIHIYVLWKFPGTLARRDM